MRMKYEKNKINEEKNNASLMNADRIKSTWLLK